MNKKISKETFKEMKNIKDGKTWYCSCECYNWEVHWNTLRTLGEL